MLYCKNYDMEEFQSLLKQNNRPTKINSETTDHMVLESVPKTTLPAKVITNNMEVDMNHPNELKPIEPNNQTKILSTQSAQSYNLSRNFPIEPPTTPPIQQPMAYQPTIAQQQQIPYQHFNPYPMMYPPQPTQNYYQPPPYYHNPYAPPQQQNDYTQKKRNVPSEDPKIVSFTTKTGKVVSFKSKKKKGEEKPENIKENQPKSNNPNEQTNVENLPK